MKKLIIVLMVAVCLAAVQAFGGPLQQNQVSAGANWVAHVNYDVLVKSQTGRLIRAELAQQGLEQKLQEFKSIFSFHLIDDIRNVTIYGNGDDRLKAVALFEGSFDQNTLISLVRMNPQYEESKHGDVVVHSWVDENKKDPNGPDQRMYGCIYKSNKVILGAGLDAVKQAVDVLNGSAANAAAGVFKQAILDKEGAFLQVAANAVGDIAQHQQDAALLQQTDELGAVMGEDDGKFYINLTLRAGSDEIAQNIKKMLEGVIAFFTLAGDKQPALAELAKKLNLSCVDRTITVYFESDPQTVVSFLKEQWAAKQQKQAPGTPQ